MIRVCIPVLFALSFLTLTSTDIAQSAELVRINSQSRPVGMLSSEDQKKLWNAYKNAKECFGHPTYGSDNAIVVRRLSKAFFQSESWVSPFSASSHQQACKISYVSKEIPRPIRRVKLDETYGKRQSDVDAAAKWFRSMATAYRYDNNAETGQIIKDALVQWANAGGLTSGINVSWGHRPVDYQMITTVLSILTAAGQVAPILTPEERKSIGPWLNDLVIRVGKSRWKDRQDNKAYMRTYTVLLWALMTRDNDLIQRVANTAKLAISDMRPDGSWPIDSQRGGMGLHYNSAATSHLVMIGLALKNADLMDLFAFSVDGRSLHKSIELVTKGIENPAETNRKYAISCPGGGDLFGSVDKPDINYVREAEGYLLAYTQHYQQLPASDYLKRRFGSYSSEDSEKNGGRAVCLFPAQASMTSAKIPESTNRVSSRRWNSEKGIFEPVSEENHSVASADKGVVQKSPQKPRRWNSQKGMFE